MHQDGPGNHAVAYTIGTHIMTIWTVGLIGAALIMIPCGIIHLLQQR